MSNTPQFFCPHWGSELLPFTDFLSKVKYAGYQGVEMSLPMDIHQRDTIVESIQSQGLKLIAQHWETADKDFDTHLANYKMRLGNLAAVNPLFINSQTGKDYYTIDQNAILINAAAEISAATGIKIIHETHRGKFSFASHITKIYLDLFPALQLCLDISHWCCVAETMLEDQEEAVQKAIRHTHHIHSRVGFTEGPQVMDPRAAEWHDMVELHIKWWQQVIDKNAAAGISTTITTEFGPFPYLQRLPYTRQPMYDQWEVNVYMMNLLRSRYKGG
ncbi:MAG: sugar phosphate isomerase/epimerase [Ferruginibacter sp.]|nr:sugar phosphate isomerase/epimerase [Ferruginibacter sp.]